VIDVHSHLMPEVDDGARSVDEALAALATFRDAGVTRLATTPHVDASLAEKPGSLQARLEELDEAWGRLRSAADDGLPTLERGAEVKLDTPTPDLNDARLRLGGTTFVLVEFPFLSVPPRSADVLRWIRTQGYVPVVAHPERYDDAAVSMSTIARWRHAGAYLQVNTGSLVGRYGPSSEALAWRLLEAGAVDILASDHHSRGRIFNPEAAAAMEELGASEQADLLLRVNPGRILDDQAPAAVAPIVLRSRLQRGIDRLMSRFGGR
jgi:protein-tyrosine phosphatase